MTPDEAREAIERGDAVLQQVGWYCAGGHKREGVEVKEPNIRLDDPCPYGVEVFVLVRNPHRRPHPGHRRTLEQVMELAYQGQREFHDQPMPDWEKATITKDEPAPVPQLFEFDLAYLQSIIGRRVVMVTADGEFIGQLRRVEHSDGKVTRVFVATNINSGADVDIAAVRSLEIEGEGPVSGR